MKILGIDPSLTCTGYSIFDYNSENDCCLFDYGKVSSNKDDLLCVRIKKMTDFIEKKIKDNNIDIISCEDQYAGMNYDTLKKLSHVRGQIMYLASLYEIDMHLYSPGQVKKLFQGKGNCSKAEMIKTANKKYNLNLDDDNIADAIACAYSFIKHPGKARVLNLAT